MIKQGIHPLLILSFEIKCLNQVGDKKSMSLHPLRASTKSPINGDLIPLNFDPQRAYP
jgi:hypothetical protein